MSSPDTDQWAKAISEELEYHEKNETWTITPVFKVLKDTSGKVYRYKARLCARGFQQPGIDYTETFAPIARYDSLRIFLALVAQLDLEVIQFDFKTAFLYRESNEDIFM
ncbi:hypothetical protein ACFW04_011978 [Cataglyphis niger]